MTNDEIFTGTLRSAERTIAWYRRRARTCRRWSRALRSAAIILAAGGALSPFADAAGAFSPEAAAFAARLGYVLIAAAAAMAGFDYYFGHSASWIRFTLTAMSLDAAATRFRYDWLMLAARPGSPALEAELVARARRFAMEVHEITQGEARTWAASFQSNMGRLDRLVNNGIARLGAGHNRER